MERIWKIDVQGRYGYSFAVKCKLDDEYDVIDLFLREIQEGNATNHVGESLLVEANTILAHHSLAKHAALGHCGSAPLHRPGAG